MAADSFFLIWACTGFDSPKLVRFHAGDGSWPRKTPAAKSNANANDMGLAPSVAEADAILARFGYVERDAAVAV